MSDSESAARGEQPTVRSMADVAAETPERSAAKQREAVGDLPDVGGLVPDDQAQ